MNKLMNLPGVKTLNRKEQQNINGGGKGRPTCCNPTIYCCSIVNSPNLDCLVYGSDDASGFTDDCV